MNQHLRSHRMLSIDEFTTAIRAGEIETVTLRATRDAFANAAVTDWELRRGFERR